jgi:hypothetical protein
MKKLKKGDCFLVKMFYGKHLVMKAPISINRDSSVLQIKKNIFSCFAMESQVQELLQITSIKKKRGEFEVRHEVDQMFASIVDIAKKHKDENQRLEEGVKLFKFKFGPPEEKVDIL